MPRYSKTNYPLNMIGKHSVDETKKKRKKTSTQDSTLMERPEVSWSRVCDAEKVSFPLFCFSFFFVSCFFSSGRRDPSMVR